MDIVLQGLSWDICLAYLDDIVVFAPTWTEHLDQLAKVFARIREVGLKIKASKCDLALREFAFWGHIVSEEGRQPDPKKLVAISATSGVPKLSQLRSFLCFAGYYRRFVKKFSAVATPLHNLTRLGVPWYWTPECDNAFNNLKERLTTAPVVA